MYAGTGGIGVMDTPDPMFLTGIDCIGCHKSQKVSEAALFTTRFTERALEESCVECHGPGTEKMLLTWVDAQGRDTDRYTYEEFDLAARRVAGFLAMSPS